MDSPPKFAVFPDSVTLALILTGGSSTNPLLWSPRASVNCFSCLHNLSFERVQGGTLSRLLTELADLI